MIHICYSVSDNCELVGTSIQSLLKNTCADVMIHLLHDSKLTAEDRIKFIDLIRRFRQRIAFYDPNQLDKLPPDIPKIIYLDSKMLVDLDISELWNLEIDKNLVAAVSSDKRFDVNLILINLNQLHLQGRGDLIPRILNAIRRHEFSADRFLPLLEKFNTPIAKDFEHGKIYRFIETPKFSAEDPFNEQFTSYFIQTPFCTPDLFGKIFNDQLRAFEELKKSTNEILNSIQREIKSKTENP